MKKKKKKKRGMFRFIVVLLLLAVFVLLFQTRSIKVKGNEYYGENSIISWLKKDKLSVNTVYLFWKERREQHFLKARKLLQGCLMWKDFLLIHRK